MANRDRGPVPVSGALVQAFAICPREAWLLGHAIEPWRNHERLSLGRLLHATAYPRARHEVSLPGMKVDLLEGKDEVVVVAEVKLSRGGERSHKLQLAYYLRRLRDLGLNVRGELRYPKERRIEPVALTPELEKELDALLAELERFLSKPKPPPPKHIRYCSSCAYFQLCWVEEL